MTRSTGPAALRQFAVLIAFLALSVAMTWPLALHMRGHVLLAPYYWDAYTNTMLMGARVNGALGHIGIYEGYFFAPITGTIAFNENLFGLSLLFAPFYLVSGNPLLAYNVTLLLSLALSGYFTFRLVLRLSGSALGGFIAGVAFAFSPYALFEIGRIQLVATQWIPLFFLFLHRATHERRLRDVLGLGLSYALQVGTCLYYAMFMLPVAALLGVLLLLRNRPFSRRFFVQLGAACIAAGGAIALMIGPYFDTRKRFSLVRSEDFAEDFDGKLSFLLHVHPDNKLLTFLRHTPLISDGAHEEIAFPTFTMSALVLLAVAVRLVGAYRVRSGGDRIRLLWRLPLYITIAAVSATFASLLTHSFLSGALLIWGFALSWRYVAPGVVPPPSPLADWLWALALTVALFVGLSPLEYDGQVVRGLYYYLHTGVPGFDGIRKVSRQAVMLMLCVAVLGGFGISIVLRAASSMRTRSILFALMLGALLLELRNAPMALAAVPAGKDVPAAYRFIASRPKNNAPIAVAPAAYGKIRFRGMRGLALHNYLALYHGRRTLNGKSSWIPPVTHVVHSALRRLPADNALRVLQLLRPQYLVLHSDDLDPRLAPDVVAGLASKTAILHEVFADGGDHVYELQPSRDKTLGLLPTPPIDERRFEPLRHKHIQVVTSRAQKSAFKMFDGDPDTRWSTQRYQQPGDWIVFGFDRKREIAALDFTNYGDPFQAPGAFELECSSDGFSYQPVVIRPRLRFYVEQIHRPSEFVFRVMLPPSTSCRTLRMTLMQEVPGRYWTIHEARIWVPLRAPQD